MVLLVVDTQRGIVDAGDTGMSYVIPWSSVKSENSRISFA